MDVRDLDREQLTKLKADYLVKLSNEGSFAEVFGVDYDSPSWYDIANADSLVPDDVVFDEYAGTDFVEEDF